MFACVKPVEPTLETIQSAMTDYLYFIRNTSLSVNIWNGPGNVSYPLAYMSFVTLAKKSSNVVNCNRVKTLLPVFTWTQLNDQAAQVATDLGYVSLLDPYRKRFIDALGTITCQGSTVLSTAYLLGYGFSLPIFDDWVRDDSSGDFQAKYFARSDATSDSLYEDLALGDVDFGGFPTALASATGKMAYIKAIPVCTYSVVPGYNLPSGIIPSNSTLVFDLPTIADIYLNKITLWSDDKIKALNPTLSLPNVEILVFLEEDNDEMIYESLSVVPGFSELVCFPPYSS